MKGRVQKNKAFVVERQTTKTNVTWFLSVQYAISTTQSRVSSVSRFIYESIAQLYFFRTTCQIIARLDFYLTILHVFVNIPVIEWENIYRKTLLTLFFKDALLLNVAQHSTRVLRFSFFLGKQCVYVHKTIELGRLGTVHYERANKSSSRSNPWTFYLFQILFSIAALPFRLSQR